MDYNKYLIKYGLTKDHIELLIDFSHIINNLALITDYVIL
jgi:hypothetical protein